MELNVTQEFLSICESIIKEGKEDTEWALIEADEHAFCFSYYDENLLTWNMEVMQVIENYDLLGNRAACNGGCGNTPTNMIVTPYR